TRETLCKVARRNAIINYKFSKLEIAHRDEVVMQLFFLQPETIPFNGTFPWFTPTCDVCTWIHHERLVRYAPWDALSGLGLTLCFLPVGRDARQGRAECR